MRSCVCVLSHSVVSDSSPTHGLEPTRLLSPWDSPGKNTGVSCHFLLQGIFLTQRSNTHFLRWQVDSLPLSTWEAQNEIITIGLNPVWWCPYRKRTFERRQTQRGKKAQETWIRLSLSSLWRNPPPPADLLISDFSRLKLWENTFLVLKPPLWYFVMTASANHCRYLRRVRRAEWEDLWGCAWTDCSPELEPRADRGPWIHNVSRAQGSCSKSSPWSSAGRMAQPPSVSFHSVPL